ncbi:hypothetical protein OMP38_26715 [Cohnella ginsengisoli]|uniref:Mannosyl-glycoprotein endo-beta-N-acetylglucosamidase-like domain-containing protein n=1 Tax=Cohnella ginsengisoli TaxID=425004 RepID=A0A9X4QP55_9BACL|nr:hypothetical protein [Cohnella ginsengisoli]MDG0794014.1 hypothetical protein [Cohnella ginsengisoli]
MRKRGWTERFRQATDLTPAGKTPILGAARCTAEEMQGYVARRNPEAPDLAERYLAAGERHGLRGDLAFCHAVHETNAWRGRGEEGLNWAAAGGSGLAASGWSRAGFQGEALEQAVEAHMLRLARYTSPERFVQGNGQAESVTGRPGVYRKWTYWEDLDGVIHPARKDGSGTVAIWRRMLEWAGKGGESRMNSSAFGVGGAEKRVDGEAQQEASRTGEIAADGAELQWLLARGLVQGPAPAAGRAVTWAELASLLRRWEEGAVLKRPEQAAPEAEEKAD